MDSICSTALVIKDVSIVFIADKKRTLAGRLGCSFMVTEKSAALGINLSMDLKLQYPDSQFWVFDSFRHRLDSEGMI